MTLFSHSLHDRQPVPVDANEADHRRMLWTRAVGRRDHGLRMAEGRVSIDSDSYVMQIGGDLLHAQAGHDGAVRVGLMAGYGEARADSVSTLIRPDGTVRARARGRTSGYAGGLYGTMPKKPAGWAPMRMPGSSSAVMTTGSAATWVPPAMHRASGPRRWKAATRSSRSRLTARWPTW